MSAYCFHCSKCQISHAGECPSSEPVDLVKLASDFNCWLKTLTEQQLKENYLRIKTELFSRLGVT